MILMRRVLLILFCLTPVLIAGCSIAPVSKWEGKELSRVTSEDGVLDAVLIQGSVDATTSKSSRVFIVPKGTQYNSASPFFAVQRASFVADRVKDLRIFWDAQRVLGIQYEDVGTRILQHFNFASVTLPDGGESNCEIRLHPVDSLPANSNR